MRIHDLIGFGMPKRVVELWHADGVNNLLPLQAEAIYGYGLLEGKDLLVCGPTSAGKTLCGEMAAMRAVREGRKAIILVPLKAIADEKYRELRQRYSQLKLKIIIVSSDYPQNKNPFMRSDYDIAVVVYEMFNALSSTGLKALENVGVVIFDEFQIICSKDRGLIYESVLAKIRCVKNDIQIIALIGGFTECRIFERWLNMPLLNATNRPVELHRGVLFDGKFSYKRYNDYSEGIEYFVNEDSNHASVSDCEFISPELVNSINILVARDEQALVFVSTRLQSQCLAEAFARILKISQAESTINKFYDLPDTMQKSSLLECLRSGVAFHNADLSMAQRNLLEDGFRAGEIRVMVCTSTLAMGVNLPSRNVFIEPAKYYDGIDGTPVLKPLMLDDYNQISGRAGRLGQGDEFGRAVIIAADDNDRESIREHFINRCAAAKVNQFDIEQLSFFVLSLIGCRIVKDYDSAKEQLRLSLRGFAEKIETTIPTRIIDNLIRHGFVTLEGCHLVCTATGKAAVTHHIELNTAAIIRDGFINHKLSDEAISWLYFITGIPECQSNLYQHRGRNIYLHEAMDEYIKSIALKENEEITGPLKAYFDNPEVEIDLQRLYTLMLLLDIIEPIPTIELERKYGIGWGQLKRLGEFYSNLLRAVADIGKSLGLKKDQLKYLRTIATAIYHGVPAQAMPLAIMQIPLLERDYILRLSAIGINTRGDVINTDFDTLLTVIPESIADKLYRICTENCRKYRTTHSQISNSNRPPLKAEKTGINYEVNINGKAVIFQPRLFKYFSKLYYSEDWVNKYDLDNGTNQVKYIYKLRQILAEYDGVTVESDNAGNYRLVIKSLFPLGQCVKPAALIAGE